MSKRQLLYFGCILVLLAGGAVFAQEEATPVAEEEVLPEVPPEHASARATILTFLNAFYPEESVDLTAAASCLDLSGLPFGPGSIKADELAVKLKQVIDRTVYVEIDKVPDDPEGPDFVLLRQSEGQVVIARADSGKWLFDRATVSTLDALHRTLESKDVVEGVAVEAPKVVSPATWLRQLTPESWRQPLLFLEVWQWIGLLALILLGVVIGRLFVFAVRGVVLGLLRRKKQVIAVKTVEGSIRPAGALLMVLVWGIGLVILGLPVNVLNIYHRAVWIIGALVAVITSYRVIDVLGEIFVQRAARTEGRFDDILIPLITRSLKIFVVAVGIVVIASQAGANVAGLLAGLGIGGLAFALAAQDTVSNLFGSLTVLLDRPFQVGDWIATGSVEGTVEDVGFRSTRIRTFYNSLITLPNSNLTNASVDNFGEREFRRWSTRLGITYDTPPEKIDAFCEGIRELIRRHPYTRKDYYHVYLNEFGAASLQIMLYVFFVAPDWSTELRERHRLCVDILRLSRELGVELAFPTQTLFVRQQEYREPALAEDGYAKGGERITGEARNKACALVDDALGGKIPPPVVIEVPEEEAVGGGE